MELPAVHRGWAGSVYAPVVELYEPINTLKPVGENLWAADRPNLRMSYLGTSFPFPTRMVVARLANGGLFLWSPTKPDEGLRSEIDALGPVRHLVSPNKIHYAHVAAWKRAYPGATAWASPGVRERAASQGAEVSFDADLGGGPEGTWSEDLDQLVFRGSRFMERVVSFHHGTRTLILADLIENFEPGRGVAVVGTVGRRGGPRRLSALSRAPATIASCRRPQRHGTLGWLSLCFRANMLVHYRSGCYSPSNRFARSTAGGSTSPMPAQTRSVATPS